MSVWCVLTVLNLPIKLFHYGTLFFWRLSCNQLSILSAQLLRTCDCLFFPLMRRHSFCPCNMYDFPPAFLQQRNWLTDQRSQLLVKKRHESFGSTAAESCLVTEWRVQRLKRACSALSSDGPESDANGSDWKTKTLRLLRHRRRTCLPVSFCSSNNTKKQKAVHLSYKTFLLTLH